MARFRRSSGFAAVAALGSIAIAGAVACRDHAPATTPEPRAEAANQSARRAAPAPAEPTHDREIAALRAFEDQRRAATDFAALPAADAALGPDPYRIAALAGGDRLIGLLRGESALVVLDRDGAELERIAAPRSPSGLAVSTAGDALVVGEAARELAHYRVIAGRLERVATLPLDALGLRDVALAPDGRTAYAVEDRTGRLLAVSLEREPGGRGGFRAPGASGVRELGRCHGPIQVAAIAGVVAVDCLLDHAIELYRETGETGDRAGAERPAPSARVPHLVPAGRIHHDGPLWGFALDREPDGGALIAAGGVEDHPLEREDGGFGYIDSFVYLYRLAPGATQPLRLAAINTSALGAVTPKWVAIHRGGAGAVSVTTAGFASPGLIELTWRGDLTAEPEVARRELPPGTSGAQRSDDGAVIAADPLFDAWIVERGGEPRVVRVAGSAPARSAMSRIGELLFFTTMMSPWNSSDGKLSRFTCETCHHEGYVDGRVHFTGRGKVYAATRPLHGLFNNRPHFSRALDKTMTQMVHAEFRVANRHNGRDPWFALTRADVPWLDQVEGAPDELSPALLRQALMSFLMDFTHRENPAAVDHERFSERERAGARVFRERCATCHAARLIADDPSSLVGFERWESLVLSRSGPIVWSDASYRKSGVVPYVHPEGARVPTLRRLYKKWPYFTSGSARSLADLLDRFAWLPAEATAGGSAGTATSYHDGAPADAGLGRLTADDKAALLAFLDLI
jgi:hypothetical protein